MQPFESSRAVFATAILLTAVVCARGQSIATDGSPKTGKPTDEEVLTLSPFEVNAKEDTGYRAANTTSGSRLNTSLKDTAASISPFTPEFISDIAANNLEEMLAYATNVEKEVEDSNAGFNSPTTRSSGGTSNDFRVRGIAASFSVDLTDSTVPQDNYNIERVEVASGPNSVLFGLGNAGGLVTLSTKRGNLSRDSNIFKTQFGSWGQQRFETDLNKVVLPKKLALRIMGLKSSRDGWRNWDFEDNDRLTAALAFVPWKNTTVRASLENGHTRRHATWQWNGGDQITLWRAAGAPVQDTFTTATDTPRGLSSYGANNRFSIYEQDGLVVNLRNELQTVGLPASAGAGTLLSPKDMPYDFSFNGPGAFFDQNFRDHQISLEQRVTKDLVVEMAFLHNQSYADMTSWAVPNNTIDLRGDPNLTIPDPRDPTGTIANPRAGQMFMEGNWRPDSTRTKNNIFRTTAAYEFNLGKWGLHRFAGLFETSGLTRTVRNEVEILVDDNNIPLANASPENTVNWLFRRHYVTPGNFASYYQGNPELSVPAAPVYVTVGTANVVRQAHVKAVSFSQGGTDQTIKNTDSYMLAMQNYFFKKHLATTFGYRIDEIVFKDGRTARLAANDPSVVSGQNVVGEWEVVPGAFDRYSYRPVTRTEGAVFHLDDRFSFFYNHSSNVGAPRLDRTILPNVLPPPTDGKGVDAGIMIDLTKDGRYVARVNYFETSFLGDTPVVPGVGNYFVTQTTQILDGLQASGFITPAEHDAHAVSFSAFTMDVISKGVEVEFVANPIRDLTLRLTYSYSNRGRDNYFSESQPWLADFKTFVRSRDKGAIIAATGLTIPQQLDTLDQAISDNRDAQIQSYATRPHKATLTTRYSFREGQLKGLFVGGAYRYQSKNYMQQDLRAGSATFGKKFYGDDIEGADFFAGYAFRVPWLKSRVTTQLNVRNAFNQSLVGRGRYNADFSGLRRVYLAEPQNWRLTVTVPL